MRTIGSRSNILFIIAAAFGLVASLGRPWYAPAQATVAKDASIGDVQGPVEGFFIRLGREFTDSGGVTGWHAFTSTDTILIVLVGVAVLSALCALAPAIEQPSRELLRLATLAMLGIVVVKLVNTPDGAGLVERRQGVWIALGVTGIMASSAASTYSAPSARSQHGPSLVERPVIAPPRSTVFDSTGSSAPELEPQQPQY